MLSIFLRVLVANLFSNMFLSVNSGSRWAAMAMEQTLYKDFCPMYSDGKGATWLSETKEIKNPYLGKKMPTCGSMKEEIN